MTVRTALLALILTGLLAIVATERTQPADLGAPPAAPPAAPPVAPPTGPSVAEAANEPSALAARLLARPLFAADRRPFRRLMDEAGPAAPLPRLLGVIVGPSGRVALFASGAGAIRAREGDRVMAMVVETIRPGEVALRGAEGLTIWRTGLGTAAAVIVADPQALSAEQRLHTRGNEDQHAE